MEANKSASESPEQLSPKKERERISQKCDFRLYWFYGSYSIHGAPARGWRRIFEGSSGPCPPGREVFLVGSCW